MSDYYIEPMTWSFVARSSVGIVTIVDLKNYGNRLQNYAVHRLFDDRGIEPTTIELSQNPARSRMRDIYYRSAKDFKDAGIVRGRFHAFAQFAREMTPYVAMTPEAFEASRRDFDFFAVGSDQVWNPNDRRLGGSSTGIQCLASVERDKKISLAPSFGLSQLPEAWQARYAGWLADFERLSVREAEGASLIRDLTGKDATVLPDPTMAVDPADWRAIASHRTTPKSPYIVTLFLGGTTEERRQRIAQLTSSSQLELIDLSNPRGQIARQTGPREFISLVDNARLVMTDSFHASVFAFMLNTALSIFPRADGDAMSSRITTFAESFGLKDRVHKDEEKRLDPSVLAFDYAEGLDTLSGRRRTFLEYLDSEIGRVAS
ncbi:polysaccharide pyruvyl transferase family protein [Microbacterium trichothecenolyticum]|uniref:polysaccharide pyruvyl transferase family protein n=1 Tax=Microbacterium trichothecenolyticum TaxID=69370 RepID=UPI0035BE777A